MKVDKKATEVEMKMKMDTVMAMEVKELNANNNEFLYIIQYKLLKKNY
jgi:hypothetical protein